jgi:hypothetical protein
VRIAWSTPAGVPFRDMWQDTPGPIAKVSLTPEAPSVAGRFHQEARAVKEELGAGAAPFMRWGCKLWQTRSGRSLGGCWTRLGSGGRARPTSSGCL